jgi:CRP/FNR family transcriptional regulator, anaerobic regulatory protein
MLNATAAIEVTATVAKTAAGTPRRSARPAPSVRQADEAENQRTAQAIAETLRLVQTHLAPTRRVVHAGDTVFQAGERFSQLHLLHAGMVKVVNLANDGREQVVALKFRGDWLGFDGIATGHHASDTVAMDTGEVWSFRYDALLAACSREPALLRVLHEAMSREITHDRDSLMSVCSLPADARVADFLRYFADSLAKRGLRTDQITLRMTRAEIGNYLGITLETVSRALSRLARWGLIEFAEKGRRELRIPDVGALAAFVQRSLAPAQTLQ